MPRDRADDGAAEPTPTETPAAKLLFVAEDIVYVGPPTQAPSGPLSITIENQGNLVHNVVFAGFHGDEPVVEAQGGESDTATIELAPGEYVFYCSIPGHREAGMEGTLTSSDGHVDDGCRPSSSRHERHRRQVSKP